MKKFICVLMSALLFSACGVEPPETSEPEIFTTIPPEPDETPAQRTERIYRRWYDEVIEGFGQNSIQETANAANAEAEYRIVYNVAMHRYDYYVLQVFLNGTGIFTFMVHKSEDFETGEIVLNVSKDLSAEEVEYLLNIINDNNFYNIPLIHPLEEDGADGKTVFIEGYDGSNVHFIKMWEPKKIYRIAKIHKAFADFADTFAERPIIRFD